MPQALPARKSRCCCSASWAAFRRPSSADRCVALEPALAHRHRHIAGAIYTPGECAADCQKTCDALLAVLGAKGVKFLLDTPVTKLLLRGGQVAAVSTPQGDIESDSYVMAMGSASALMARKLGVYLPVYPLKGYSITVDLDGQPQTAPAISVTDTARKVVFARLGSRLRVAGMAELAGYDTGIADKQIASLQASTQQMFPGCSAFKDVHPWAGLRPATPTGLPVIGRHPNGPGNLLFNTGHGALGFTLAFGSAQRIARMLEATQFQPGLTEALAA
jgi:D-amino-acid dehydrogenase